MEIGIIGATRGMGRWFADFLSAAGYVVHRTGRSQGLSLPELAARCSVVIVSVPIASTLEVIAEVGPHLREDGLLMDLTSVKAEPVAAMLKATTAEVVGCHPLFGPGIDHIAGQNIVLCPGRGEKWLAWWKNFLWEKGARVTETTPERHDELMALIQGLNHINTITMGLVLAKSGESLLRLSGVTTPLFRDKAAIVKRLFGNSPDLYAHILTSNPHLEEVLTIYEETLQELRTLVRKKDAKALSALLESYGRLLGVPDRD